jgi:hypothetical protein
MFEFLKNHYGKILTGTTGTIIFTVVGVFFSDARYVHQSKEKEYRAAVQQQIDIIQQRIDELKNSGR